MTNKLDAIVCRVIDDDRTFVTSTYTSYLYSCTLNIVSLLRAPAMLLIW
jgi:hypothetical protein